MKIRELIEILERFDPQADVYVDASTDEWEGVCDPNPVDADKFPRGRQLVDDTTRPQGRGEGVKAVIL